MSKLEIPDSGLAKTSDEAPPLHHRGSSQIEMGDSPDPVVSVGQMQIPGAGADCPDVSLSVLPRQPPLLSPILYLILGHPCTLNTSPTFIAADTLDFSTSSECLTSVLRLRSFWGRFWSV